MTITVEEFTAKLAEFFISQSDDVSDDVFSASISPTKRAIFVELCDEEGGASGVRIVLIVGEGK